MSSRKFKDKPHSSRSTRNDISKVIEVDPTPHAPPAERRENTRGPPTTRGQDDRQTLRRGESDDYYNSAVTLGPSAGPSFVKSPTHYNGGGGREGGPPALAQQYPAHMGGGSYGVPSQPPGGQHNGGSGGSESHGHGGYTGGGPIYHAGYGEPMKPAHYSSHVAAGAMFRPSDAEQHQGYYQSGSGCFGGEGGGGGASQQGIGGSYGAPPQLQHSQTYGAPPPSNQFINSGYNHPQQTQGANPPRRDSTSSSSSSSYVDISRTYPIPLVKKNPLGALRTFFTAPSESRRRVIRRKSSRTLRAQRREGKKISGRRSSSSEGSSVDSDLAYGTGYLRRRKSNRRGSRGSRSPRRYGQGHSRSPRRYGSPARDGLNGRDGRNRENLRPAGGVPLPGLYHSSTMPGSFPIEASVVAAGSAAIAAGLSHHSSSSSKPPKPSKQSKKDAEEEILKLGEDLHKLAKQQNRYDLEEAAKRGKYNVVRDDHRLGRHGYGPKSLSGGVSPTRGIAPSRPAKGPKKPKDDDGWETSDSDNTSSSESVDDALGYGEENTYQTWRWREPSHPPRNARNARQNTQSDKNQHYPHPPTRKSTIVDPKLFGPQNSLAGSVTRPVGFGEVDDLREDGRTPLEPPTVKQTGYFRSPVPSPRPVEIQDLENRRQTTEAETKRREPSPARSRTVELTQVFPMPTEDPGVFDITRGSASTPSRIGETEKRPSFHARTDSLPLRQPKPMSPVRRELYDSPEKKIERKDKKQSSSRSNDLALGGLAGAALAAAVAAGMSSPEIERYKGKERRDNGKGKTKAGDKDVDEAPVHSKRIFKDDMARRNGRRPEGVPDRRDSYGFPGAPASAVSPMSTREGKVDPFQYQVDKWEDEESSRGTDYDPKGKKPMHERIAARAAGNGRDTGGSTPLHYQEDVARDRQREAEYQEQLYSSSPEVVRRGYGSVNRLSERTDSGRVMETRPRAVHERIASRAAESNPDTGRSSPTQKLLDDEAERRIAEVLAKWAPKRAADIAARRVELAQMDRMDEMDNLAVGEGIERRSTPAPEIKVVERRPKWADDRDVSPIPTSRAPMDYSPQMAREKEKDRANSSGRWLPESPDLKRVKGDVGEGSNYAPPMVRTASDADHRYAQMNDDYFGSNPNSSYSPKDLRTKERRRGRSRTRSPGGEERGRGRTRSRSAVKTRSPSREPEIREARSPLNKSARDGSPVDVYDAKFDRDRRFTEKDAEDLYEEERHFTAPLPAAAIGAAIAAVHRDEDRHRGDDHSHHDGQGKEVPRDKIQEEADRYYREMELARKLAKQRDNDPTPRVITPPAMEHHHESPTKGSEIYGVPDADFKFDHEMTPDELPLFSPVALRKRFSLPENFDETKPFDPRIIGLARPILNIVRPTPTPEKQVAVPKLREPRSRSQSREDKRETSRGVPHNDDKPSYSKPYTPSDVEDEPSNTFQEIPTITQASQDNDDKDEKSVSWGTDDIQHYVPITPYDEPRNPHDSSISSIPSSPETTRAAPYGLPHSRSHERRKSESDNEIEDERKGKGNGKGKAKEAKETPEKRPKPKSLWSKYIPDLASQIRQREELAYNLANASTIGFADGEEGREVSREEVQELAMERGKRFQEQDWELEKGEVFEYRGIVVEPEPPRKHRNKNHRKRDVVVDQDEEERGRDHRDRTVSPPPVGPKPSTSEVAGGRMPGAFSDDEVAFARPLGVSPPTSDVSTVIYHQPSELSDSAGIATGFNTAVHSIIGGDHERSVPLNLARGISDDSFVDVQPQTRGMASFDESFVLVEEDKPTAEAQPDETMVVTVETPHHHTESFAVVDHASSVPSEETQPLIADAKPALDRSMTEDTEDFVTPMEEAMTPFDASIEGISAPQIEAAPLGAVDTTIQPNVEETSRQVIDTLAQDASMMPLPESSKETVTEDEASSSLKSKKKKKKGKKGAVSDTATESASCPLDLEAKVSEKQEKQEDIPFGDKFMSEETQHECRIAEVLLSDAIPEPESSIFPSANEVAEETGHPEEVSKEIIIDLATPAVEDSKKFATGPSDTQEKNLEGKIPSSAVPSQSAEVIASEITEPNNSARTDHDSITTTRDTAHEEPAADAQTSRTRELGDTSPGLAPLDTIDDPLQAEEFIDVKKDEKADNKSGINSDLAAVALAGTVAVVADIANKMLGSKDEDRKEELKEVGEVKERREFVEEEAPSGLNAKQRKAWKKKQDQARKAWTSAQASVEQSGRQTPAVQDAPVEVASTPAAVQEDINKEIDNTPLQDAIEVVEPTPEAITDRGEAAEYYNPIREASDVPAGTPREVVDTPGTEQVLDQAKEVVAEDIPATSETLNSNATTIIVDAPAPTLEAGVDNSKDAIKTIHENVEASAPVEMVFDKGFNMEVPAGLNKKRKREWVKAKKAQDMETETKRFLESVKGTEAYISSENSRPIGGKGLSLFRPVEMGVSGTDKVDEQAPAPAPSTEDPTTIVVEVSEPKPETGAENLEEGIKAVHDNVEATETPLPVSADVSTEASGTDSQTEEQMPKGYNKKEKKAREKKQKEIKMQRELDAAATEAVKADVPAEVMGGSSKEILPESAAEPIIVEEARKDIVETTPEVVSKPPGVVEESKEITEPVSEEPTDIFVEAAEPQSETGIATLDDAVTAIHGNVESTPISISESGQTAGQSSSDVQTEEEMPKGLNKKQKKAWQKKQEEARMQREIDSAAAEAAKVESDATIVPVEIAEEQSKDISEPVPEIVSESPVVEEVSKDLIKPVSEPIIIEESRHVTDPVPEESATIVVEAPSPAPEAGVENFEDAVRAIHDATANYPAEIGETPIVASDSAVQSSSDFTTEEEMPKGLNKKQKKAWQKKQAEARIQRELVAPALQGIQTEAEATIAPSEVVNGLSKDIVEPATETASEPVVVEVPSTEVVEPPSEVVSEPSVVEEQSRDISEPISIPGIVDQPAPAIIESPAETSIEAIDSRAVISDEPPKKMNKRDKKAWDKAQREAKALAEAEAEATAAAPETSPTFEVPEVLLTPVFEDESGAFATAPMATPIPTPLEEPAQPDTPPDEEGTVSLSMEEAAALAASDPEAASGDVSLSIEEAAVLVGDLPSRKLSKKEKKALEKAQKAKELDMESSTTTETEGRVAVPTDAFKDIQDIQQNPDAGDVVEDEWGTSALATPMEVPSMITPDVGKPLGTPAEETEVSLGGKKKKKKGKGKIVEIEPEPMTPLAEPDVVRNFIDPATETTRDIDQVREPVIDPVAETLALLGGIARSRATPADIHQSVESAEQQIESPTDDDDAFHSAAEDRGRSETPTGTIGTIDDDEFKDFHSTNEDDFQSPANGHHAMPEIVKSLPHVAEGVKEPEVAIEEDFTPVGGKKKKKKKKGKGASGGGSGSGDVSGTVTPGGETEKESFLANAGTLGAGVGSATVLEESRDINSEIWANADAAGRWESQPSDVMKMVGEDKIGEEEREGTVVGHDDGKDVLAGVTFERRREENPVEENMKLLEGVDYQSKLGDILNDPEIREREVLPSVDPQFGDLLPLPPRDSPPNEEVDGGALATQLPLTPVVETHAQFQSMMLGGIQEQNEPSETKEEVFTIDPEIQERKIHPSVDPQYGDLLPLPPSQPGSPARSLEEEILTTQLPDSPPESPAVARLSLDSSSPQTPKKKDTTHLVRSPSISAVPLKFLLGNRSTPSSPVVGKGSPVLTSPTRSEFTERPKSRHSWDSSKGLQPLQLLERRHSRGSSLAEFDSRALAPLLEGAKAQHDRSSERGANDAVLTDEGETSTPAEAFATAVSEKQGQDEYFGAPAEVAIESAPVTIQSSSTDIADTATQGHDDSAVLQPLSQSPLKTSIESATESANFVEEEMPKGLNAKARKAWKAKQKKAKDIFEAEQLASKTATVETETEPETVVSILPADAASVLETDSGEQSTSEAVAVEEPQPFVEDGVAQPAIIEPLDEIPAESEAIIDILQPSIARKTSPTDSALGTPLESSTESPFVEEEMPQSLNAKARKAWKKKQDKAREVFEAEQVQNIATAETGTNPEVARSEIVETPLEPPTQKVAGKSIGGDDTPREVQETTIVADDTPLHAPTAMIPDESANKTDSCEPLVARNITLPDSGNATPLESSTKSPLVEGEMPTDLNAKQRKAWKKKQDQAKADWGSGLALTSAAESELDTPAVQDTPRILSEPIVEALIAEETPAPIENVVEPIALSEPLEVSSDIDAEIVPEPAAIEEPQAALEDVAMDTPLPNAPLNAQWAVAEAAVFVEEEMPAGLNAKARKAWKKKQDNAREEFESASAATSGGWTDSGAQTPAVVAPTSKMVQESGETPVIEPIQTPEAVAPAVDTSSSGTISDFDAAVRALHDKASEVIKPIEAPAQTDTPLESPTQPEVTVASEDTQAEASALETPFKVPASMTQPVPFVEEEMPTGLNAKQRKAWKKKQQKANDDRESGLTSISVGESGVHTPAVVEASTESDTLAPVVKDSQEASQDVDLSAPIEQTELPIVEIEELPIISKQQPSTTTNLESLLQQIPAVEMIPEPSTLDITSAQAVVEPVAIEDVTAKTPHRSEQQEDRMVQETPKLEIGGFIQTPAVEIGEPNLPQQPLFVEEEMPSGLNAKARKAWKKKQEKARADFESVSASASASASTGESGFQTPAAQDIQSEVVGKSLKEVTEPSAVTAAPVIEETRELSQSIPALGDIAPVSQPAEIAAEVPSEVAAAIDESMPAVENIQPVTSLEYVEEEMPVGLNAKQRKAWKKKQEKAKADYESGLTSTFAGESGLQTPAFEEAPAMVVDEPAKVTAQPESALSATSFSTDVLVDEQPIPVAVPAASTIDTTIYDVSDPAEQPTLVQPETIAIPQSVEQTLAAVMLPYESGGLAAEYFEGMGTPSGPLSPSIRPAALSHDMVAKELVETIVPIEQSTSIDESRKSKKDKKKSLIADEEQVSESQGEKGDVDSSAFETTSTKKAKKKKGKGKECTVKQAAAEVLHPVEEKKASEADDMDEHVAPKEIAPPTMLPGKVEDAFSRPQSPVAATDGAVDSAKDKKKKKKKGKKGVVEDADTPVIIEPSLDSVAIPAEPESEALFQDEADRTPPDVFTVLEAAQDIKQPAPAVAPIESEANDSPPTPDAVRETLALLGGISHTREPIVKISAQPDMLSEMAKETVTTEQPAPVIEGTPSAEVSEAPRDLVAQPSPVEKTQPILDSAPTTDGSALITEPTTESQIAQDIPLPQTPIESSSGSALEFVDEEMPKGFNSKASKAWKVKQKKAKEIFEAEQLVNKSATVETEIEPEVVEQEIKTKNVLETPNDQTDAPIDVAKEVETIEPSSIVVKVVSEVPISEPLQVVPPKPQALVDNLEPPIARNISLPYSSGSATRVELVEETAKDIALADPPSEQHVEVPTGIVAAPIERHVSKEVTLSGTPLETSTESTAEAVNFVEEEMPKGLNAKKRKEWKKKQDKAREDFEAEQAEMRTATVETETEHEAVRQEMKTGSVLETPSDQTDLPTEVSKEKEKEIETLDQSQSVDEDFITESAAAPPLADIPTQPDAIIDALEPSIARNIALPDSSGTATPIGSTEAETDAGGKKKKKKKGKKALLQWEDETTSTPSEEMTADKLQAKMDAEKAAQLEAVVEEILDHSEPVAVIPVLELAEIEEHTPKTETSQELLFEPTIKEVPLPISAATNEIPLPETALATSLNNTEAESSSAFESASSKKSERKKKGKQAAILWEEEPASLAPEAAIEASEVVEKVIEPKSKDVAAQVAQPRVVVQAVKPADEDYVNRPSTDTVWIEDENKEKDGEIEQVETIGDTTMEEVASEPLRSEEAANNIPLPETPVETATESSGLDSGLSRKASKKKKKGKKNAVLREVEPANPALGSPVLGVADETPKGVEIVGTPPEQHIEVSSNEHVTISEPVLHEAIVEVGHPSTPLNAEHVDVAVDIAKQLSDRIEPVERNISGTASGANTPFVSVSVNEDSDRTPSEKTPEEPIENTEQPKAAFLEHSASGKGSISQQLERAPVFETTGAGGVGNFREAETVVEAAQRRSSESGDGEQEEGKGEIGGCPLAGEEEVMPQGLDRKQKKAWEKAAEKRRVETQLAKSDELALAAAAEKEAEEIVEKPILESMEEPTESEIIAEKSVYELAIETPLPKPTSETPLETPLESEAVDEWAPTKKLTKKQQALEKAQREAVVRADADSAGNAPIVEPEISKEPIVVRAVEETPLESIIVKNDVQGAAVETAVLETPLESETQPETPLDSQFEEEEMPKGSNKKQRKAWEKAAEKRRVERELAAEDEKRLAEAAEKEVAQIVEEPVVESAELEREVVLEEETPKMERKLTKNEQKAADKKRREEEEQAEYAPKQSEQDIAEEEAPAPTTPAEQTSREIVEKPPMEETNTEDETAIGDEWAPTRKLSQKEKKALDKKHKDADEQALLVAATAAVTTGAALSAAEMLSKYEPASKSRIVEESSPSTPVEERILIEMPAIDEGVKDTPLQVTSRDTVEEPSTESRTDYDSSPANTKAKRRDKGKGEAVEAEDPPTEKRSVLTPIETTRDVDEQDRSSRAGNDAPIAAVFHARSLSPPSGSGIFQQALEKVVEKQVQQRDLQENIAKEAVKGSWSFSSLANENKPDTPWSASRLPSVLEEDASEQPRTPTSPTRPRSPVHRSLPQDDSGYVPAYNSPKPRPRSWFDPEYVRDSGVQLREKRSSDFQPSLKDLANTDDVLARSWPPVNEERETVDLRRKKRSSLKESRSAPYEKITPVDIEKAATGLGIASGHKRSLSKSPALSESPSREFLLRKANRSQTPSSEEKGNSSSTSSRQPSALKGLERGETPRSASDREHSRQSSLLESQHLERTRSPRSFSDQIHNPRTRTRRTSQEREDYYNRGATPTLSERGLGSSLSRPGSVISNRSVTPSLRRVSGRASTDLRALSQSDLKVQQSAQSAKEADSGSASDAKTSPPDSDVNKRADNNSGTDISASGPPLPNEGRQRVKGMAEVYNGFGEGRMGSPRSPTRPHSMRRKQSMQLLDMQAQMAAMAEELAAARQEKAVILQAKEAAERNLDEARREASKAGQYKVQAEEVRGLLESMTLKNTDLTRQTLDLQAQLELRDNGVEAAIAAAVAAAIASKEAEVQQLRARAERLSHDWSGDEREIEELETIISSQKAEIATLRASQSTSAAASRGAPDYLADFHKNDGYFEQSCQKLFRGVWRWIHAFSDRRKHSPISLDHIKSLPDQRIYSWLKDAFAGNPSAYLADLDKRRLVLMSLTMSLFHHYVFGKHFFGLDATREEASKVLEMIVDDSDISDAEFRTWRATQFCLFSKSHSYTSQRNSEVIAVTQSVLHKLSSVLPQPSNSASDEQRTKILIGELQIIVKKAAELSNDMRRQRSKYIWQQSPKALWGAPRSKAPERFIAGSMTHAEICVQFMELHRVDEKLSDASISAEVRATLNNERAMHLGTLVRDFHIIAENEAMVPGFRLSWEEMLRRMEEKNRRIEEKGMGVRLTLFPMVIREADTSGEGQEGQIIWKAVVKPVDLKIPTPGGKRRTSDMGSVAGGSEHGSKHARVR